MGPAVAALPVRDADGGPATQELTPTAAVWPVGGHRGDYRGHRVVGCWGNQREAGNQLEILIYTTNVDVGGWGGTSGTAQLIAAVATVGVTVTHPGVDDAPSRAAAEAVWGTGGGAWGRRVGGGATYRHKKTRSGPYRCAFQLRGFEGRL